MVSKANGPFCWQKRQTHGVLLKGVALSLSTLFLMQSPALALPEGAQSVSGNVRFSRDNNQMNITTGANRSIVNYQSFNIAPGEAVHFSLPSTQAAILNRVIGGNPSEILGLLTGNGQIFLVNPAGIFFGPSAQVQVGSLFASTLNISDRHFLNGVLQFHQEGTAGALSNAGTVHADQSVTFMGGALENSGSINAPIVNLAVGRNMTVNIDDHLAVSVTMDSKLTDAVTGYQAAINNTGIIQGDFIRLRAGLESQLYAQAINNTGELIAHAMTEQGGQIALIADGTLTNNGLVDVSGTDNAPNGGRIVVKADSIIQADRLLAEGADGGHGGSIMISSTRNTMLSSGSLMSVRGAGDRGDAGQIKVWSDGDTHFQQGSVIDARGGALAGDGGFVEVSGKHSVWFNGQAYGGATQGKGGTILIDPDNITIDPDLVIVPVSGGDSSSGPDEDLDEDVGNNVNYSPNPGGTFDEFAEVFLKASHNINVNYHFDLANATGNNSASVILSAGNDIRINAPLITHSTPIQLNAGHGITVRNQGLISTTGSGSGADVIMTAQTVNIPNTIQVGQGSVFLNGNCIGGNCGPTASEVNTLQLAQLTGGFGILYVNGVNQTMYRQNEPLVSQPFLPPNSNVPSIANSDSGMPTSGQPLVMDNVNTDGMLMATDINQITGDAPDVTATVFNPNQSAEPNLTDGPPGMIFDEATQTWIPYEGSRMQDTLLREGIPNGDYHLIPPPTLSAPTTNPPPSPDNTADSSEPNTTTSDNGHLSEPPSDSTTPSNDGASLEIASAPAPVLPISVPPPPNIIVAAVPQPLPLTPSSTPSNTNFDIRSVGASPNNPIMLTLALNPEQQPATLPTITTGNGTPVNLDIHVLPDMQHYLNQMVVTLFIDAPSGVPMIPDLEL